MAVKTIILVTYVVLIIITVSHVCRRLGANNARLDILMTNVTNNAQRSVLVPVILNQGIVAAAKITIMVKAATFLVHLRAKYEQRQVEVYVSRQMGSVYMDVLMVSMVYSVPRNVLFIVTIHSVTEMTANVQRVAKLK
jgi:hypothetical protein